MMQRAASSTRFVNLLTSSTQRTTASFRSWSSTTTPTTTTTTPTTPTTPTTTTTALRRLEPLRTSLLPPSASLRYPRPDCNKRNMSTSEGSEPANTNQKPCTSVIHKKHFGGRTFILNRPEALNALNLDMIRNMTPQLQAWEASELCKTILITSNMRPRAFCAGGDVKSMVQNIKDGKRAEAMKFIEEEYKLNHLLATVKTPIVAILDGITMGGGVGISVHAPFRIATENTVFAMPETAIGFIPDVGGSFFLSRMDGQLGTYLGLTGQKLKGEDVFHAGIATHFVPSSRITLLEERLNELESNDPDVVSLAIEEFAETPTSKPLSAISSTDRAVIDRCFRFQTMGEIMKSLESDGSEFAQKTMATLEKMCPTALKITLQMLRQGKGKSIRACLEMEYRIVHMLMQHPDFVEGVTALLVEKRPPVWVPQTLSEVNDDKVYNTYFTGLSNLRLKFHSPDDLNEYRYKRFGGPSESDVYNLIVGRKAASGDLSWNAQEVEQFFVKASRWKHGVRERVRNILDRKTVANAEGWLNWVHEDYDSEKQKRR